MKIINPEKLHKYTVIILHGMYVDNTSYNIISNDISKINNNIKVILPNAPIRDIDWPDGKEKNVSSWYNYYTRRDGELIHDDINIYHYNKQLKKIKNIIESEAKIVSYKNIILMGESQGGTIVLGLGLNYNNKLGGIIGINTVFMDNILKNNICINNFYLYSAKEDEIYRLKLQKKSIKNLNIENNIIEWYIQENDGHCDYNVNMNNFIINSINKIMDQ